VKHAADPGCQGCLQDVNRAKVINLMEGATPQCPQLGIRGEVVHFLTATNGVFHDSSVADVTAQQFDAVKPEMGHASLRPVKDAHVDAPVEQRLHQVAADEAGSAGHKNGTANRTHGADTSAIRGAIRF
jgi:hypothetical protein